MQDEPDALRANPTLLTRPSRVRRFDRSLPASVVSLLEKGDENAHVGSDVIKSARQYLAGYWCIQPKMHGRVHRPARTAIPAYKLERCGAGTSCPAFDYQRFEDYCAKI